ncbi:MAG: NAD(P)H-hydrate epimerase [Gemmatales bacterium]|nr:NAD(P)H-hydrate epimerase [Gemmatales bacterium]MDW8175870.1 NAD(P)H-hydrate epimerase [Gemmatales bacterium]
MLALTRDQVQAFDRWAIEQLGVPGTVLMENAGRGCAEVLLHVVAQRTGKPLSPCFSRVSIISSPETIQEATTCASANPIPRQRVVVCCGRGNNGGDGYVLARHLSLANFQVKVLAFADPDQLTGEARWAADIYRRLGGIVHDCWNTPLDESRLRNLIADADWIADALFGTGLKGAVRPPFDRVLEIINTSHKPILAVDIPSGLDCDTGQPLGIAIRADCTATMAAWKRGFLTESARQFTGDVYVVSLGVPVEAWLALQTPVVASGQNFGGYPR